MHQDGRTDGRKVRDAEGVSRVTQAIGIAQIEREISRGRDSRGKICGDSEKSKIQSRRAPPLNKNSPALLQAPSTSPPPSRWIEIRI